MLFSFLPSPFSPHLLPSPPFPFPLAALTGGKLVTASQPELLAHDQHANRSYYISEALLEIFIPQSLLNSSFSGKFRMKMLSYTSVTALGSIAIGLQSRHSSALLTRHRGKKTNVSAGLPTSPCCEFKCPFTITTDSYMPAPGWLIKVSEPGRHSVCPHRDLNTLCRAQLSIAIFLTQATNNSGTASPSCAQKDIYQAEFYLLGLAIHNRARPLILPP